MKKTRIRTKTNAIIELSDYNCHYRFLFANMTICLTKTSLHSSFPGSNNVQQYVLLIRVLLMSVVNL